jgi:hypothetical protein
MAAQRVQDKMNEGAACIRRYGAVRTDCGAAKGLMVIPDKFNEGCKPAFNRMG